MKIYRIHKSEYNPGEVDPWETDAAYCIRKEKAKELLKDIVLKRLSHSAWDAAHWSQDDCRVDFKYVIYEIQECDLIE